MLTTDMLENDLNNTKELDEYYKKRAKDQLERIFTDHYINGDLAGILLESVGKEGVFGGLERTAKIIGGSSAGNSPWMNTYPFGVETNQLCNVFFGLCLGYTHLEGALNALNDFCQKHKDKNNENPLSAVIITDKWNRTAFKRYEKRLFGLATNLNIDIIIILATDYGYTEVPIFVCQNSRKNMNSNYRIY